MGEFDEVFDNLDPDNKTGLHVRARYGYALANFSEAFWRYSNRNTKRGKLIGQVEENVRACGGAAGSNSDEYILMRLQRAIENFEKTLDLNPMSYDAEVKGSKKEFNFIRIENIFGRWQSGFYITFGEAQHNHSGKCSKWEFYSEQPLDLHCEYGIRDADLLIYRMSHEQKEVEDTRQEAEDDDPKVANILEKWKQYQNQNQSLGGNALAGWFPVLHRD